MNEEPRTEKGSEQVTTEPSQSLNPPVAPSREGFAFFWRLWWRALSVKRPQAALALGSLLVAASITSLLLNLYGGVRRKMAEDFRAYGANVVLGPAAPPGGAGAHPGNLMDEASLHPLPALEQRTSGMVAAPILYGIVRLARTEADPRLPGFVNVVAVGTDFAGLRRINSGWHEIAGDSKAPLAPGTCILGAHLAGMLRLKAGDTVRWESIAGPAERRPDAPLPPSPYRVAGVLSTGAAEDDQVFVSLQELQSRLGLEGQVSLVELAVPGETAQVERVVSELSRALPGVEVRPIRQIIYSEGKVLGTIRWLLLSLTALILAIIGICVMATMTAIVLERRKDIGVMKALGAGDTLVIRLFLAEGVSLGLVGGVAGFILGDLLAQGVARRLFGVTVGLSGWSLPVVCGLTVLLAGGATLFPVRIVRAIQPAVVLKGE